MGPLDGRYGCDKVYLGVVLTFSLFSYDENQSFLIDETPGRGFMTIQSFMEDLSLGR